MFELLLMLWQENKITEIHLTNAVNKGWITEEQKQEIMSQ